MDVKITSYWRSKHHTRIIKNITIDTTTTKTIVKQMSGLFGQDVTLSEDIDDDLYWACHSGTDENRLLELIRKGANVNASVGRKQNMTPLIAAVSGGHVHTVRLLLQRGAEVNIRANGNVNGPTPLHVACRHGMLEMVNVLLENNCEIDPLDGNSNTPADLAGKIHHSGIIKVLNEQKMKLMMQGGSNSPVGVPRKDSHHRRQSTDAGEAARELDESGSSFTPPAVPAVEKLRDSSASNNNGHSRTTSSDLEMLLVAHRQLTVRESARDRQLQRIQDSVTNLQSGMHRMVTMVDGLRLLVVQSLQTNEKETVARIEQSTSESMKQFDATKKQLVHEQEKTAKLQAKCQQMQAGMKREQLRSEELEENLKHTKKHLEMALDKKWEEGKKKKQQHQEAMEIKIEKTMKSNVMKPTSSSSMGIGSEAQKRLARLAAEKKQAVAKKTTNPAPNFGDDRYGGLFDDDSDDGGGDGSGDGDGGNGKQLATTIHRERRPSSTAFHKEPNVRRLSRTDQLLKTMIVDLSPFYMADDVVEKSTEKPAEKKGTCSDDLFDFA